MQRFLSAAPAGRLVLNPLFGLWIGLVAVICLLLWHGPGVATLTPGMRLLIAVAAGLAIGLVMMFGTRVRTRLTKLQRDVRRSEGHAMRAARELSLTLDHMGQGIVVVSPRGEIVVINERCLELLGLPRTHFGRRHSDAKLLAEIAAADEHQREEQGYGTAAPARLRSRSGARAATRAEHTLANGTVLEIETMVLPDGGFVRTLTDITARRRSEEEVTRLTRRDGLTGLANRTEFRACLAHHLASSDAGLAVLLIDLDHFKSVNDSCGHPSGDRVLQVVGARLRQAVRADDVVARQGGDEFAILQLGVTTAPHALALAERISGLLAEPCAVDGTHVVIGASIGVAVAPDHGRAGEELLKAADLALHSAKADGRGVVRLFEHHMMQRATELRQLEADLKTAVTSRQFEVFYQPVHAVGDGSVTGYEALLRWRHPVRGLVPPLEFIPIAEDTRLIVPIGAYVLNEACRAVAALPGAPRIAVNLSPVQLRADGLVATVRQALADAGLAPERLELEITERVLLEQDSRTLALLHELRALGVRIAMDDFGTGYSSLSYLLSFPFDRIKIDKAFVAELTSRESCGAIVRAITGLAASLGIATTAEGVETAEQLRGLGRLGCEEAQGYLFAPPRPAGEAFAEAAAAPLSRAAAAAA